MTGALTGRDVDDAVGGGRGVRTPPNVPGSDLGRSRQRREVVVLVQADRRRPQLRRPMSGSSPTTRPPLPVAITTRGRPRRGRSGVWTRSRSNRSCGMHLVVPAQLAGLRRRARPPSRCRGSAPAGSSRSGTRRCRGTAPGWRRPSRRGRARVDRRRVPRAAAGVDLGVAPQVATGPCRRSSATSPVAASSAWMHAAVAGRVDAADAHRDGADEHQSRRTPSAGCRRRSSAWRESLRAHSSSPVGARRGRRRRSSPCMPNTRPSATATPNGPMLKP